MSDTSEIENRLAKITIAGSDGMPWTVLSGDLGGALCQANADIRTLLDRLSSSERRVKSLEEALGWCIDLIERAHAAEIDGWEPNYDDTELSPDGSYRLSQARAVLEGKDGAR